MQLDAGSRDGQIDRVLELWQNVTTQVLAQHHLEQVVSERTRQLEVEHQRLESLVPAATFTNPEIASVGLTEREAAAEGRTLKIGRFPFRAHGRSIADGELTGFVKLIADAGTDQVLGAHIIGAKASELIHECALAIAADLNAADLAHAIHAHPTLTETIGEAAEDLERMAIHILRQEAKAAAR